MPLKVFKTCCQNCLLSKDRIVSNKRMKEIIEQCRKEQGYFICHKATMNGDDQIVCKSFYDQLGHLSQTIRIAERLNMIQFVEQTDSEKLTPYRKLKS